jgi:hypothetical protein
VLPAERLEHYERTERAVRRHHPDVPFLDALAREIALLCSASQSRRRPADNLR